MQLKKKHRKFSVKSRKRCWYCGDVLTRRSASIDHMTPKCQGGSEEDDNKVLCCKSCNNEKDNMTVETYRWFLQQRLPAGERVTFFGEQFAPDTNT